MIYRRFTSTFTPRHTTRDGCRVGGSCLTLKCTRLQMITVCFIKWIPRPHLDVCFLENAKYFILFLQILTHSTNSSLNLCDRVEYLHTTTHFLSSQQLGHQLYDHLLLPGSSSMSGFQTVDWVLHPYPGPGPSFILLSGSCAQVRHRVRLSYCYPGPAHGCGTVSDFHTAIRVLRAGAG